MTEPLSPAAQAVASAYDDTPEKDTGNHRYLWLAAALRAAADQVVPVDQSTDRRKDGPLLSGDRVWDDHTAAICRRQLLAIAAELDGIND